MLGARAARDRRRALRSWLAYALAWLLLALAAVPGCCSAAAEPSVRPLLPEGVEPTAEEQADLERREGGWLYLDAEGQPVPDDMEPTTVVMPFPDLMALLGVLDGWRAAARAYREAGLFQER